MSFVPSLLIAVLGLAGASLDADVASDGQVAQATPTSSADILSQVERCVDELYPEHTGTGGSPLRFDALTLEPFALSYASTGALYAWPEHTSDTWLVTIPEEERTTIPTGVAFAINLRTGACSHVPRD